MNKPIHEGFGGEVASTLQKGSYLNSLELIDSPKPLEENPRALAPRPKTGKTRANFFSVRESNDYS